MVLDAPAAGSVAKVINNPADRAEGSVPIIDRYIHAGVAKADDIGPSVTSQIGEETGMVFYAPAAGGVAKIIDHSLNGTEAAVAVIQCYIDAGIAETDNIRPAITREISKEARMLFDAPATGIVAKVIYDQPWAIFIIVLIAQRMVIEDGVGRHPTRDRWLHEIV